MAINKLLFEDIINQIKLEDFQNVEIKLQSFVDQTESLSNEDYFLACYIRGYLHTLYQYSDRKEYIAKEMLLRNINSDYPIPSAYCFYAELLDDKNAALNYLKSGLEVFSESADIYFSILKYCSKVN